jgi:hypothetical protein
MGADGQSKPAAPVGRRRPLRGSARGGLGHDLIARHCRRDPALAVATFSAVRSSNRSARLAELALQEQPRPLLIHARLDDPVQKIMFADGHWILAQASEAVIDAEEGDLYLGLAVSNAGAGIAVRLGRDAGHSLVDEVDDHCALADRGRAALD